MTEELRTLIFEVLAQDPGVERPWGWIGLVASRHGLRFLSLPVVSHEAALHRVRKHYVDVLVVPDDPFLSSVAGQVKAYLCGESNQFAVELDLRGHTPFELSVWATALRIPFGETRTYAWIAGQIGTGSTSAQAVGSALGNNPVPLIVPCHRVIGSDGSLHGFAGGLDMKARLLALESRQLRLAVD